MELQERRAVEPRRQASFDDGRQLSTYSSTVAVLYAGRIDCFTIVEHQHQLRRRLVIVGVLNNTSALKVLSNCTNGAAELELPYFV